MRSPCILLQGQRSCVCPMRRQFFQSRPSATNRRWKRSTKNYRIAVYDDAVDEGTHRDTPTNDRHHAFVTNRRRQFILRHTTPDIQFTWHTLFPIEFAIQRIHQETEHTTDVTMTDNIKGVIGSEELMKYIEANGSNWASDLILYLHQWGLCAILQDLHSDGMLLVLHPSYRLS